eukprot:PhF_6_TR8338/c0_g1_i1/m.13032
MSKKLVSGTQASSSNYTPFSWALERTLTRGGSTYNLLTKDPPHPEMPTSIATWHAMRKITTKIPSEVSLHILSTLSTKHNAAPLIRQLVVDHFTTAQRAQLIDILLERGLFPEAVIQMNILMSTDVYEIPLETLLRLWKGFARHDVVCHSSMTEWLAKMPKGWPIPHDIALKLLMGSVLAPPTMAYRVLSAYSITPAPHSAHPYQAFFLIARNSLKSQTLSQQDANVSTPARGVLHWKVTWRFFQTLNRTTPDWPNQLTTQQFQSVCHNIMEVLLSRAPPILCLFVARSMTRAGGLDSLGSAILMIRRLGSQKSLEGAVVARRIYKWFVNGNLFLNMQPHEIFAIANTLIRMQLFDCVEDLYNSLFENIHQYDQDFKNLLVTTFADIVCPECSNILNDKNVHNARVCPSCFTAIPAKNATLRASYEPSTTVLDIAKKKKSVNMVAAVQELRGLARAPPQAPPINVSSSAVRTKDAAAVLKREVLEETILPSRVHFTTKEGSRRDFKLSLPADHLDAKDFKAIFTERAVASRRQEIEARQSVLRADALSLAPEIPTTVRARVPSEVSFAPPLLPLDSPEGTLAALGGVDKSLTPPLNVLSLLQTHASFRPVSCVWDCLWCEEENPPEVTTACIACGAEAGPAALWRVPRRPAAHNAPKKLDGLSNLDELAYRLQDIKQKKREDAVAATYWLMLYRKKFLIHANETQLSALNDLVFRLAHDHERVMAAYVFFRIIPGSFRSMDCVPLLMSLFGTATPQNVLEANNTKPQNLSSLVLGNDTCSICFDHSHTWKSCPIVTRRFPTIPGATVRPKSTLFSLSLDPEHAKKPVIAKPVVRVSKPSLSQQEQKLKQETAFIEHVKGASDFQTSKVAFGAFLTLLDRHLFAETHVDEVTSLALALAKNNLRRHAAFLLCHIPKHHRSNELYIAVAGCYEITQEDIVGLLDKRTLGDVHGNHPNIQQVLRVCCVCLEQSHASHQCPYFQDWYKIEVSNRSERSVSGYRGRTKGEIQAEGFATSGPERLEAFQKFLISMTADLVKRQGPVGAIPLGIHVTITEFVRKQNASSALHMVVSFPRRYLRDEGVEATMKALKYHTDDIKFVLSMKEVPMQYVVPSTHCMICFSPGHVFRNCPLHQKKTPEHRIADTLVSLVSLKQTAAISAAADYIWGLHLRSVCPNVLSSSVLAPHLENLILQCVTADQLKRAIHVFMVLPRCSKDIGLNVFGRLQIGDADMKSLLMGGARNVPDLNRILSRNGVCPYCMVREDHSVRCPTLQSELDMGRNVLAIFRTEVLEEEAYSVNAFQRLSDLFLKYRDHLPYHISAMRRAVNAVTAMWALESNVTRAMQQLKAIPQQYRDRTPYRLLLREYGVEDRKIVQALQVIPLASEDEDVIHCEPCPDISDTIFSGVKQLCGKCYKIDHATSDCTASETNLMMKVDPVQVFEHQKLEAAVKAIQSDLEAKIGEPIGANHPIFTSGNVS